MRLLILFVSLVFFVVKNPIARAADPFLKPNDVIAFVGGEDMVVAAELGYIETLLQRALPSYKLKFRSLAWEGDTVFEQKRDLNYPSLEAQLDKIGATVVICQFGQMESLAGKEKFPDFIAAYEKLIKRLNGGGKRRFALIDLGNSWPRSKPGEQTPKFPKKATVEWWSGVLAFAKEHGHPFIRTTFDTSNFDFPGDGVHMTTAGHNRLAIIATGPLGGDAGSKIPEWREVWHDDESQPLNPLRRLIAAKNRLWFHYYRPQNWAFLAGDRTNQPSSRDHKDPSKRWFPAELEKFIPLVEEKEKEIWALAEKLAKEGGAK